MRNWIIGIITFIMLVIPPTVGYATAPCEELTGRPLALSPYRLEQQTFLQKSAAALDEMALVSTELNAIAAGNDPASMAESFRRAGKVSDLAARLEQIILPEAPVIYELLGERLNQTRDTYSLAAEKLLSYLGNNSSEDLQQARDALTLADTSQADLTQAVAGLRYPLCREVWHRDRR